MKNFRTTLLGIFMILGAIGTAGTATFDGDPNTEPDYTLTFTAVSAGIGLILAREQKTHDSEN